MLNQRTNLYSEYGGTPVRDTTSSDRIGSGGLPGVFETINFNKVGRGLVWASLGLGLWQVLRPKQVQKMIGVRRGDHSGLIKLVGVREILSAFLLLVRSRPLTGVWSRVAGDVMDIGLLAAAYNSPRAKKDRVLKAAAAILGITAIDTLTAAQLNSKRAEEMRYETVMPKELKQRTRNGAFLANKSITIYASPEALYQFWRNFESLPQFMYHLDSVRVIDDRRSHWVAKAPAGMQVEWDAEITEDRPNEMIAWRSIEGADVPNSGEVRFEPAPAGRGTVVRVMIEYRPPGGELGKLVAKLFGEEPSQQVAGDLRRFKQVVEIGEVVRSEGSPSGFGQKLQHPARPMKEDKNIERMPRFGEGKQRDQEKNRDSMRER